MFQRGDVVYILENNLSVKQAKVMNRQGDLYTIQLIGSCVAFRVSESRLFESEDAAIKSKDDTYFVSSFLFSRSSIVFLINSINSSEEIRELR